jgi:hypothetical protein
VALHVVWLPQINPEDRSINNRLLMTLNRIGDNLILNSERVMGMDGVGVSCIVLL